MTFFLFRQNAQFWSLGLEFQVSSLGVPDEVSVSKVTASTTSLLWCDKGVRLSPLRTGVSKNVFALRTGLGLELFCGPTINIITNVWWWKFVTAQKSAPGNEFLTDRRWAATRISSTTNFSIMTVKIDG